MEDWKVIGLSIEREEFRGFEWIDDDIGGVGGVVYFSGINGGRR